MWHVRAVTEYNTNTKYNTHKIQVKYTKHETDKMKWYEAKTETD